MSSVQLPENDRVARRWWRQGWLLGLLLVIATLIVYQPAWQGEAVYDDNDHLTPQQLQSMRGLVRIWTELGVVSQYYPVTHSVFWLEHRLWGDAMLGYHLTNILLHAACALLLVRLLQRLRVRGAWLAGAIFALHPLMVESVAWISELKNTLSGVFYLSAAIAYVRYDQDRQLKWHITALVLFVAGLLSKGVIATFPAALLVVFWWQRGRLSWRRDVMPLVPFFVVGIAMGLFTAWVERRFIGAEGAAFELAPLERVLIAGRVTWFYIGHLFWPANYSLIYPRWAVSTADGWQYLYPAAALLAIAGAWAVRSRWRGVLAAALFYLGTLFPVLGFLNVFPFRYSFVADHFAYLPSLGIIVGVSAVAVEMRERWLRRGGLPGHVPGLVLLATLAVLSWRVSHLYRDEETLWRTTIARNPACFIAYNNLSIRSLHQGAIDEAIRMAEKAIQLCPDLAEAHNNLGNALHRKGRDDEALQHYQRALVFWPKVAKVHCNVGYALQAKGRLDEAIASFRRAVELQPEFARAHVDLANALLNQGRTDEAIEQLKTALSILPDDPDAHASLGNALLHKGDVDRATGHLQKALAARPDVATTENDLGNALLRQGRVDEAIPHYRQALVLQPDFGLAHHNLACALLQKDDVDQAIVSLRNALAVDPGMMIAHYHLGCLLAEKGRFDEAVIHYRKAVALQPDFVEAHTGLADALQRRGRAAEAVLHRREALKVQPDNVPVLTGLAWLLATSPDPSVRDGADAVRLAGRANQLTGGRDAVVLRTLAAAYAENGRLAEAVATAQEALRLAEAKPDPALAGALRSQLQLHQAGTPLRETGE